MLGKMIKSGNYHTINTIRLAATTYLFIYFLNYIEWYNYDFRDDEWIKIKIKFILKKIYNILKLTKLKMNKFILVNSLIKFENFEIKSPKII